MSFTKKILCSLTFLILHGLFFTSVSNAAAYTSVETFLANQQIIRVMADDGPGFGNQAASVNVVTHLRQMGFKGIIEFIYPGIDIDKISLLFDLPQNLPDNYFDAQKNIRFIKMKFFVTQNKNGMIKPITLGMTGGFYPPPCSVAAADGAEVTDDGSLFCANMANFTSTQFFAQLNPLYLGPVDRPGRTQTSIYTMNEQEEFYQPNSGEKFVVAPVDSLVSIKKYLQQDPQGQLLSQKKPGLITLINSIQNQSVNVLFAYGKTLRFLQGDGWDPSYLSNVLQMMTGARVAQLIGQTDFNKPLIIPVFYDYKKEGAVLTQLINSKTWGEYENTFSGVDQARNMINKLNLPANFSVADISDPQSIQQIKLLQPGKILLLSLGSLPKKVFDGLYNHTGTNVWPQIREGASSFNSLVLTGKAHFRCGTIDGFEKNGWDIGFDLIKDSHLKLRLNNFYNHFCDPNAWQNHSDTVIEFGKLMIEAQNPSSAFSQYFSFLQSEAIKPENDRVRYAIEGILNQ